MADITDTYAIASPTWPGLAKLLEECGEVIQVLAKLMVAPDLDHTWTHPSGATTGWGDLSDPLHEELGDLYAALTFFVQHNPQIDEDRYTERATEKYNTFTRWHEEGHLDQTPG